MFVYLPLYRITYSLDQNLELMHIYQVGNELRANFVELTAKANEFYGGGCESGNLSFTKRTFCMVMNSLKVSAEY